MFTIKSVYRDSADSVTVEVSISAKDWSKLAKQGHLGMLYGIDISNEVFRSFGILAMHPTVDDAARAVKGVKHISLSYRDSQWTSNVVQVDFAKRCKVA